MGELLRASYRVLLRANDHLSRMASGIAGRLLLWLAGVEVGAGVRVWGLPLVRLARDSRVRLGARVVLCSRSADTALGVARPVVLRTLAPSACIDIGEDTGLSGTIICAALAVRIGRRCLLGADTMIFDTDFHALHPDDRRRNADAGAAGQSPVTLGDDVFVGARACILKGVRVGDGAVIGCAAVVTHDVPAGMVVVGNPARIVGPVPRSEERR